MTATSLSGVRRAAAGAPAGAFGGQRGSVTVEAAVALSAIVLLLALCLAGVGCLVAAVRVTDAAGEAARLAARGDPDSARAAVVRLAPAGSVLSLTGRDLVTAAVSAPPLGGLLPGVHIGAKAVAAREPGEPGR